jgi:hypothetical protein
MEAYVLLTLLADSRVKRSMGITAQYTECFVEISPNIL